MSSSDAPVIKSALKSKAWKFFRIKDKILKIAKCKLCQKSLSYRTSVTNLLKHVKKRHEKAFLEYGPGKLDTYEATAFSLSEDEDDDCNDNDSEVKRAVKVLESLDTKNQEESVCLLCHVTFSDLNSGEMMEHMVKVHNISQIKLVDGNLHLEQEENKPVKRNNSKRSTCWEYFTLCDKKAKIAQCNLCDGQFSFKSTVSNLIKHVQKKHNITPKRNQDRCMTDNDEKLNYKPRSTLWSLFNYVNSEKTVCACVHCNKEFNTVGGTTHMKKHLLDKHPEALLHNEEDILEVEYLDLDDLDMEDSGTRKATIDRGSSFERKPDSEQRLSFQRRPSFEHRSSLDQRCIRPQVDQGSVLEQNNGSVLSQTKVPDSLEHFAHYITALLQELPEKISKKLQMNFVKQIIEAQISCVEIENTNERVTSKVNATEINSDASVESVEELDILDQPVTVDGPVIVGEPVSVAGAVTVNERINTIPSNTVNSTRVVTVANGYIIRPIVTTS